MTGTFKPADASADAGQWQKTACILCECSCGLEVSLDGRRLAKIRGDKQHPGSQGYTCEKPLRLQHYQGGPHRLDTPMRRRSDGTYESIGWDAALDEIATRLQDIRRRHGGQAFGFYGGGGQGNHHHDHPSFPQFAPGTNMPSQLAACRPPRRFSAARVPLDLGMLVPPDRTDGITTREERWTRGSTAWPAPLARNH